MDRRLTGAGDKYGWRYTRYADDLTFSLPKVSKKKPCVGSLKHAVGLIVKDEGFTVHPKKTRVTRDGSRQKVTGLVVNGEGSPRVPKQRIRELRATIHNLKKGQPLREGENYSQLEGYAAFIYMTNPELGGKMIQDIRALSEKAVMA
jgi:hypothetical protein